MTRALAPGRAGDTIFALATGPGRAAIAVLRLSGARTAAIASAIAGKLPQPRIAALRNLLDSDSNILDRAIVLWLPGPASYTGEDMAELQVHGGRAVLAAVTGRLLQLGARPADPGEFSRRAFLAGKMDFLEAEAIADLVDAETEAQRRQALRQMQGAPADLVTGLADRLKRCLAFQEALIDFPDENLPEDVERSLINDLQGIRAEIGSQIGRAKRAEKLRHGLVVAITGAPNVGKSSLLNALAQRDVAIVSHLPGTTRDSIEVAIELGGIKITLIDTAGLRDTQDPIEAEGVRRAGDRAASADLVLLLTAGAPGPTPPLNTLTIVTKIDLAPGPSGTLGISTKTGEGLAALEACLADHATRLTSAGADPVLNRARHTAALRDTEAALAAALTATLPELRGEDLRLAVQALGRVTGVVGAEDVLDDVFGAFCIGK